MSGLFLCIPHNRETALLSTSLNTPCTSKINPILQSWRVEFPIYLLAVAPLDELGAALRILRWNVREVIKHQRQISTNLNLLASLLYQIQKLLVITDKLLKLTDFRRKPRWVLPQILRRDLTVNCPYISGRLPTIRWQPAWLARAEIKRCCCNGGDVQVAQPWGGHYHPPACKRQVKQSSAVAKIGLSRQNLFNFLAFKLTSWHYEPWSECWFMVPSFRPSWEVPKKLWHGGTVCQFWEAQVLGAQGKWRERCLFYNVRVRYLQLAPQTTIIIYTKVTPLTARAGQQPIL